jgi:type I restriction enzyme S subunit
MNQKDDILPDGYRLTELGPLPEEWRVVRLREVADIGPSRIQRDSRDVLPFIPMSLIPEQGLFILQWEYKTPEEIRSGVVIKEGDLLLAKITPCLENGKQGIVRGIPGGWGYATTEVFPIRSGDQLLTEILALYLLQAHVRQHLVAKMEGTTGRQRLPRSVLLTLPIPLPPLPEQRAIARVLRAVQLAREATERVIAATRELKKSLMRHLFTHGPVPVDAADQVPMQETDIGPIPAHWRVVRLGEIFEIQQGKALSPQARAGNRKRPFLRTSNVLWGRIDLTVLDEMHFEPREEQSLALRSGDLLVCEGGDIGRTAMWEGQLPLCLYQNHLHRLRAIRDHGVEPAFYMYWMQAAWTLFGLYGGSANRTTIPNLSRSRLASFAVPSPPLPEQQEIARILQAVDRKIAAEEARKQALDALFKTLLHELMTARRRLPADFVAHFATGAQGLAPQPMDAHTGNNQ